MGHILCKSAEGKVNLWISYGYSLVCCSFGKRCPDRIRMQHLCGLPATWGHGQHHINIGYHKIIFRHGTACHVNMLAVEVPNEPLFVLFWSGKDEKSIRLSDIHFIIGGQVCDDRLQVRAAA